jgi:cell wall-associated NlpC family hydrolase
VRPLTLKQIERVVAAARKFVDGRIAGKDTITIGKVTHEPNVGGRCSQFCRESFQAGTGRPESDTAGLFGGSAKETARLMRGEGFSVGNTSDLQPGDFLYRGNGPYGHIAMYVGTDVPGHEGVHIIAENTSSGTRGVPRAPGTKYTRRGTGEGEFGRWSEVFRLTEQ